MTTSSKAATAEITARVASGIAARTVALASVALALETDLSRVDDAKQAYEGGLAAELGKWPSWVAFAEAVGVKAEHLNCAEDETKAFRRVLDVIMDKVIRDAWSSQKITNLIDESKALVAQGKHAEAKDVDRQVQSARTRRTELANVVKYGAVVGRYVLDRMTQERELANVHKATVWASVFSQCNRHCDAARKAGAVITREDLLSIAAGTLDGQGAPEKTEDEKALAIGAQLRKLVSTAGTKGVLTDDEVRRIKLILDRNPRTQKLATDVEASVQPVTRKSDPAPAATKPVAATKPTKPTKATKATKPAAPVETKAASDPAAVVADVI